LCDKSFTIRKRSFGAEISSTVLSIRVKANLLIPQAINKAKQANKNPIITFPFTALKNRFCIAAAMN